MKGALDETVWVLNQPTGTSIYDFDFRAYFPCRTPWQREAEVVAVARTGAFEDYEAAYLRLLTEGIRLVHTPEEHARCSQLSGWYPLLSDLTPHSQWYAEPPTAEQISQEFTWPVFVKGLRQTNRHQRRLSIIDTPEQFTSAMDIYRQDQILKWQPVVVREYLPLRLVADDDPARIPASFEFRTFWWRGRLVGAGRYWWESRSYDWNESERAAGLAMAQEAARRMNVPYLVIDLAQTASGHWIVIECNDGQESGYAGVSPLGLWQNLIEIEKASSAGVM